MEVGTHLCEVAHREAGREQLLLLLAPCCLMLLARLRPQRLLARRSGSGT
jgi:hypothetical protein